ncbi:MAG: hypothetical protein LAT62_00920 [Natronospirillum sp.]|uniref:hypothetical protein n=1 Tax=Natronospirillum sp. TaxID=2812955 RepID=UPI0025DF30D9|nr:hypothetical protein [Natronospirillum sp.]MCH8550465.1 hypothetical protein [Natronospirillum sp.]
MSIKSFIGRFHEIRDRSRAEQDVLLEQARYEVFVNQRRTGQVALYLLAGLAVGFVITIGGWWQLRLQNPMWGFACLAAGIGVASLIYRTLYRGLLQKGLSEVLRQEARRSMSRS